MNACVGLQGLLIQLAGIPEQPANDANEPYDVAHLFFAEPHGVIMTREFLEGMGLLASVDGGDETSFVSGLQHQLCCRLGAGRVRCACVPVKAARNHSISAEDPTRYQKDLQCLFDIKNLDDEAVSSLQSDLF